MELFQAGQYTIKDKEAFLNHAFRYTKIISVLRLLCDVSFKHSHPGVHSGRQCIVSSAQLDKFLRLTTHKTHLCLPHFLVILSILKDMTVIRYNSGKSHLYVLLAVFMITYIVCYLILIYLLMHLSLRSI